MVCTCFPELLGVSHIFPAAGFNFLQMPPLPVKGLRLLKSRTMKLWTHGKLLVYSASTSPYPVLNGVFVQGPGVSGGSAD